MSESRHTWGDLVRVIETAPEIYRPGEIGEVCGVTIMTTEEISAAFEEPLGTAVYTVEFTDGTAVEVPDRFLEKNLCEEENRRQD